MTEELCSHLSEGICNTNITRLGVMRPGKTRQIKKKMWWMTSCEMYLEAAALLQQYQYFILFLISNTLLKTCCKNGSTSWYLSYMVSQIVCPVLYNLLNLEKMRTFESAFSPAQNKGGSLVKKVWNSPKLLSIHKRSGRPCFQTEFWASGVKEDS